MHLTSVLGACLAALSSTSVAMPHMAGPYHGNRIAISVPTNITGAYNATTTGTRGKLPLSTGLPRPLNETGRQMTHRVETGAEVPPFNHCYELCSLESQTCTIAVPNDDKFW